MAVLCRSYFSHEAARRAVGSLLDAGVPGSGVRVLMGERVRDVRTEPKGEFVGEALPGAPVGDFAGRHPRGETIGGFAGTAGSHREGTFADADSDTVTSYPDGVERVRVKSHGSLRSLLVDAGLDEATADRDVAALHEGRILVLADTGPVDAAEAQARLEGADD